MIRALKWPIIGFFAVIVGMGVIFWTPDTDATAMRAKYGSPESSSSAQWFKQQLRNAKVIVYPGLGHLMIEEIPAKSGADLSKWLATLPAPR